MIDQLSRLQANLTPLAPLIHQSLIGARRATKSDSRQYSGRRRWLRPDLFRANLGDHIADALPTGWALDEDEIKQRGAILLRSADGYIQARMQRVESDGSIPEARTDRRKSYYDNCRIDELDLNGLCNHRLVFTFEENADAEDVDHFEVRVIRPYRDPAGVYSMPMPDGAGAFAQAHFEIENTDSYNELFGEDFGAASTS